MGYCLANAAFTMEGEPAGFDFCAGLPGGALAQGGRHFQLLQILNLAAGVAHEVDMRVSIAIEPLHTLHRAKAEDDPLLFELVQVAVDSCQAQIRVVCFQPEVDPLGTGVLRGASKQFQNCFTLLAVALDGLHGKHLLDLLNDNSYRLCLFYIIHFVVCKEVFSKKLRKFF